jgi:hypothetical protein
MNLEWRKKLEGFHYANQTQHKEWMIEWGEGEDQVIVLIG